MMMASEVPMHSCMRTSSGTSSDAEHFVQHRHDDGAAADAEQAGENADQDAGARNPAARAKRSR